MMNVHDECAQSVPSSRKPSPDSRSSLLQLRSAPIIASIGIHAPILPKSEHYTLTPIASLACQQIKRCSHDRAIVAVLLKARVTCIT